MGKVIKGICFVLCGVILIGMGLLIGKIKGDNMALASECASFNQDVDELTNKIDELNKEKKALQQQIDELNTKNKSLELENKQSAAKEKPDAVGLAQALAVAYQTGTGYKCKYFEFDHMSDKYYVIHAYDVMSYDDDDGEEVSWAATCNWYDVDVDTLEVYPEF